MTFEEAYVKITENFVPLYQALDHRIELTQELADKRFKKGKDKSYIEEFGLLLNGQKLLYQMTEEHSKFIYALREVLGEYGDHIERLSGHIENLARKSNNLEILNDIKLLKNELGGVKNKVDKVDSKVNDARKEIESFDNDFDDIFGNFARGKKKDIK